jgi:hypothetical protein
MSSFVSLGIMAGHAATAQGCTRAPERAAFDVVGLKSQLMVTAISCQMEERYNAFVMRYRPDLVRQEHMLSAYFERAFGHGGTREHDDYITALANAQSQNGIRLGSGFCSQSAGLFDEVMALKSGRELPVLAATKTLTQPIALVECVSGTRTAMASSKR